MKNVNSNSTIEVLNLGSQIRILRLLRKIPLTELAEKAGISKTYLSLIEANEKVPDIKILFSICEALEIKAHELLMKAHLENINEITERCWEDNYNKIRKSVDLIGSKLYPKEKEIEFCKEESAMLTN